VAVPLPPPPSDTICVASRPVGAPAAAVAVASADPSIALVRAALRDDRPAPAVQPAALVRYLPPAPTKNKLEVRAAAALDPSHPGEGWLAVEAVTALGRSGTPLHLTVMLDTSDSMHSVPSAAYPPLHDEAPGGAYRNVSRLDIARTALLQLTERLPSRADVSLVVFDRDQAEVLLRPTPAGAAEEIRFALGRASQQVARQGSRSPLETTYTLASLTFDPCADNRILLVTDENTYMARDPAQVDQTVRRWAERGLELWTLSVGQLGARPALVESLTQAGRGVLVYADTVSEAVEPLGAALRATGTAVRSPGVTIHLDGATRPPACSAASIPPGRR
jgi:hypothetical protein